LTINVHKPTKALFDWGWYTSSFYLWTMSWSRWKLPVTTRAQMALNCTFGT